MVDFVVGLHYFSVFVLSACFSLCVLDNHVSNNEVVCSLAHDFTGRSVNLHVSKTFSRRFMFLKKKKNLP